MKDFIDKFLFILFILCLLGLALCVCSLYLITF